MQRQIKKDSLRLTLCLLCILLSPLVTVSARAAQGNSTLYVDSAHGADSNPGTSVRPLKTIARAAQIAVSNYQANKSTEVLIQPGTYRESISLATKARPSEGGISFEPASPGAVVLSGADVWAGWQPDSSVAGQYVHPWPYHSGPCNLPPNWPPLTDVVRRREMIFVNGSALAPALSGDNLQPGSYFVDEANGRAVIRPAAGTDVTGATIEVSTRPRLLDSHGVSHLTIRGLSFIAASSCVSAGAVEIWDGSNVLVEDSSFQWNNWDGLKLFNATNSVIRRTVSSHNGSAGFIGHQLTGITFEDLDTSYNNWRGALGKFYYFENGGAKLMRTHNSTFKNFRAVGNQTIGLWFDSDNSNIVVDESYLCRNEINGIFLEANQGPVTIKNSKLCSNIHEGILSFATQNVTLTGNLLYANGGAQIFVDDRNPFRSDHDWETGAPYTSSSIHWTLSQNTIVGETEKQSLIKWFPPPPGSPTQFLETLSSDANAWFQPANKTPFVLDPGGPGHKTHNVAFSEWKSSTGQDQQSTFAQPSIDLAGMCAAP
jgi:Right handed beta helix region